MSHPSDPISIEAIKSLLLPIVRRYGIKSVSLFGSYARNEATPCSDVDLLIEGGNFHGLTEYVKMIEEMKLALGKDVDVITQTALDQVRTEADALFKQRIEKEKIDLM